MGSRLALLLDIIRGDMSLLKRETCLIDNTVQLTYCSFHSGAFSEHGILCSVKREDVDVWYNRRQREHCAESG